MKMKIIILFIFIFSLVDAQTYTDAEARRLLSKAGVSVNHPEPRTSLKGVRKNTIDMVLILKRASKCNLVVTGGTEPGHSSRGTKNHGTGYKIDYRLNSCLENYIKRSFVYIGKRSDGAVMYKSRAGNIYAKEWNHWDVLYV